MYRGVQVAVVVPAYNEELAIADTLTRVPEFVDLVVVVDDASSDESSQQISQLASADGRIVQMSHPKNRGVGAAISTGYREILRRYPHINIAAVMAGDGQMDPDDLPALLDPIVDERADYTKGNRFAHAEVWSAMPKTRLAGNVLLSLATKITSGYPTLFDSQCGYTAIHRRALLTLDIDRLFPRYGYPNDLLARLKQARMRVVDVPVRPIYGPQWSSGIRPHMVVYPISYVLLSSFARRVLDRA